MYDCCWVVSGQTLHFKFINQLSAAATQLNMPREHECSAYNFHSDLFLSGLERIIMVSRPLILPSSFRSCFRLTNRPPSRSDLPRLDEEHRQYTIPLCISRLRGMCRTLAWLATMSLGQSPGLSDSHLPLCVSLGRTNHRPPRARPLQPTGNRGRDHLLQRGGRRIRMGTETETGRRSLPLDYSTREQTKKKQRKVSQIADPVFLLNRDDRAVMSVLVIFLYCIANDFIPEWGG